MNNVPKQNTERLNLLIDQYSRQEWVRRIIDRLRDGKKQFSIVDVGGYMGKTREFQTNDNVIVCDLFDVDEPNYIKGDGRKLPFKNHEFDFAVSFDTLEHVPRKERKQFLAELCRVSRMGVLLAAPFDNVNGDIIAAERDLYQLNIDLYGTEHRWLKEHLQYVVPNEKEFELMIKDLGLLHTKLSTNDLDIWQLVQSIYLLIGLDEDLRGRVDEINRYYNSHLEELDLNNSTSYRKVYFICSNKERIKHVKSLITSYDSLNPSAKYRFIAFALSIVGKKYRDVEWYKGYLEKEVARLKGEVTILTKKNTPKDRLMGIINLGRSAITKRATRRKIQGKK